MKYNAKPITHDGIAGYGVFAGKRWWPSTFDTDKEKVHQAAIKKSAEWHLAQALELVKQVESFEEAQSLGHDANEVIDIICDKGIESGEIDWCDMRGWLA